MHTTDPQQWSARNGGLKCCSRRDLPTGFIPAGAAVIRGSDLCNVNRKLFCSDYRLFNFHSHPIHISTMRVFRAHCLSFTTHISGWMYCRCPYNIPAYLTDTPPSPSLATVVDEMLSFTIDKGYPYANGQGCRAGHIGSGLCLCFVGLSNQMPALDVYPCFSILAS